jgi:hypothetical protein
MSKSAFNTILKLTAPAVLVALSGCAAAPFRADVSRFQQLPPAQGQSFAIKAADPADEGGIEFATYAGIVAQRMQSLGYTQAAAGTKSDLTVKLDYGVDKGQERRVVSRDPFYDPFWGYGGGHYSPYYYRGRRHAGFAYGYYDPFLFGGHGYGRGGYDVDSYTVYTSGLDLKITRSADGQNVFEGKAEAKSRSNRLNYLVPNLVEAMFTGFPGNNGETVRISVAPEPRKKK